MPLTSPRKSMITRHSWLRSAWHRVRSVRYAFYNTRRVFTRIYDTNQWGDSTSLSGPGSSPELSAALLSELPRLLDQYEIESILDIPCGDFSWMRRLPFSGRYVGVDIVAPLIRKNLEIYGDERHEFLVLDLLTDELPAADVVLCRDCMVHLSNRNVLQAFRNILRSRSTYLLATHFPQSTRNGNIVTGAWRPINLEAAPFKLPPPLHKIEEPKSLHPGKTLSLWRIADIRDHTQ